jgi:hypothetical protein
MLPEFFRVPVLWGMDTTPGCRVILNPRGYMNWHGEFENRSVNPRLGVEVNPQRN